MSEEQRKDEETEVEGHGAFPPKYGANDEPGDEVEGHGAFPPKYGANDEPGDEVEGHGPSRPSTAPTMSPRTRSRATSIAAARRSGTNFKGPGSAGPFHLRAWKRKIAEDRGFAARLGKYR